MEGDAGETEVILSVERDDESFVFGIGSAGECEVFEDDAVGVYFMQEGRWVGLDIVVRGDSTVECFFVLNYNKILAGGSVRVTYAAVNPGSAVGDFKEEKSVVEFGVFAIAHSPFVDCYGVAGVGAGEEEKFVRIVADGDDSVGEVGKFGKRKGLRVGRDVDEERVNAGVGDVLAKADGILVAFFECIERVSPSCGFHYSVIERIDGGFCMKGQ